MTEFAAMGRVLTSLSRIPEIMIPPKTEKRMCRRKYSLIVVMLWLSGALAFAGSPQATTIIAAEYFIDTDPGQGFGPSLYPVDGAFDEATEEVQATFNTSALSVGTHTVYVRMRDSEGNWGAARGQSFRVKSPIAPKYMAGAEYFIDTDPGEGFGTSLYAVDGIFDEATEEVQGTFNTSGVSVGTHTAYVRMRDSEGRWGAARGQSFRVKSPITPKYIAGAEYFIDTDPGEGFGTSLYAVDGIFDEATEEVQGTFNTFGVSVGTHTVYVRMRNSEGRWGGGRGQAFAVKILDIVAPSAPISLTASRTSWFKYNYFSVSWTNPPDSSGVAGAYYKLDSAPENNIDGTYVAGDGITSIAGIKVSGDGQHIIYVWLKDKAGNVDCTKRRATLLFYDATPPLAPTGLVVTPSGWTRHNYFTISWTNPSELSGIAGAYYKLDTAPENVTDGTYVSKDGISSIADIKVSGSGVHKIYVWLKDKAGNVNYVNRASTTLHYDVTPPPKPESVTADGSNPSPWKNTKTFTINWTNPPDSSEIAGAWYKLSETPKHSVDGAYTTKKPFTVTVTTEGEETLYIWLQDGVGNKSHSNYATVILRCDSYVSYPGTITATPADWSSANSFTVSWKNPTDISGITGFYYKLDSTPKNSTDGTYVAGDGISSIKDIKVPSEGAHNVYVWLKDKAGNVNYLRRGSTTLHYDATPPSTPIGLTASRTDWFKYNYFSVSWSNPSDSSGVAGAHYKLDSAPENNTDGTYVAGDGIASIAGIKVSGDGQHIIYVWLEDKAGNLTYANRVSTTLYYDATPPSAPISLTASPSTWRRINYFTVSWENPSELSGIAGAYYKADTPPKSNTDGTYVSGNGITSIKGIKVSGEGKHTVYVWLKDKTGNVNYLTRVSTALHYDATAPSGPINLIASPSGWTRQSFFTVHWTNPADSSGIAGAYYKLDSIPESNTDGTYISSGDTITSIENIKVPDDGRHTIYVWLKDRTGNVGYLKRASTSLFYDATAPLAPVKLTPDPSGWSPVNSFSLSWENPAELSGIAGAYYKLDSAPTSDDDGIFISENRITSLVDIKVADEGAHTIYVWLKDQVENVDYRNRSSTTLHYDATPPSVAGELVANGFNPSPWKNVASFAIDWTNPADIGEIAGAWYKLGAAPESVEDGTYTTDKPFSITVDSEGGQVLYVWLQDRAGNSNHINSAMVTLRYDCSAPSAPTGITADGANLSPWKKTPSFTVDWTNPYDLSGIVGAWYKLGEAPTNPTDGKCTTSKPFTVTADSEGVETLHIWLEDGGGNRDHMNNGTATLRYDKTAALAPTGITAYPSGWTPTNFFTVTWTNASDASRIVGAFYKLDSEPTSNTDGVFIAGSGISSIPDITVPTEGEHTIYLWLKDGAGNVNCVNWGSTSLRYDASPPAAPDSLTADDSNPSPWKNTPSFTIDWVNPLDPSGIAGAWYKLDAAPENPTDGTYTTRKPFMAMIGAEGTQALHVWLQDGAGNKSHANFTTVTLRYDATAPSIPEDFSAIAYNGQVILTWSSNAEPDLSSYIIYRSQTEDFNPTPSDSIGRVDQPDTTFTDIGLTNGVTYYYRISAVDNAGNESEFSTEVTATPQAPHSGPIWHVSTMGSDETGDGSEAYPFAIIQTGIDAASNGDTVIVEPGRYTPSENGEEFPVALKSDILVISSAGPESTIVDAEGTGRVFTGEDIKNCTISGLTLTGGQGSKGGGIYIASSTGITIKSCNLTRNTASFGGGGIHVTDSQDILMEGNFISENTAWNSGGVDLARNTNTVFRCNVVVQNSSTNHCGGIMIYGGDDLVVNNTVVGNITSGDGGGILSAYYTVPTLLNNIIVQNEAGGQGGGISFREGASAIIKYNDVWNNGMDYGGGVEAGEGDISVDPLFQGGEPFCYALGEGSPCIDAGDPSSPLDPDGTRADIGAVYFDQRAVIADTTAPSAPINLVANGSSPSPWQNTLSFTINWTNPPDASEVVRSHYSLGSEPAGNEDATGTAAGTPPITVQISQEGEIPLYLWLEDGSGNVDYRDTAVVILRVDRTPPSGSVASSADTSRPIEFTVLWSSGEDVGGSGLSGRYDVKVRDDEGSWVDWKMDFKGRSAVFTGIHAHTYQFEAGARDSAGNVEAFKDSAEAITVVDTTVTIVDKTAPPAPIDLQADGSSPSPWNNTSTFTIEWTNPFDESNIAGTWYKLGVVPESSTDGTYTTDKPFTSTNTTEGEQVLYVWLQDGAGNKSHSNFATVTLRYDATRPSAPLLVSPVDGFSTKDVTPTFDWENVTEPLGSGVSNYMLMVDDNPDFSSPEYTDTTDIWPLTPSTDLNPGIYYWRVRAEDNAGNLSDWSEVRSFTVIGPLASIEVVPSDTTVASGASVQFVAKGTDNYGKSVDVAPIWNVEPPDLGEIDSGGFFTAGEIDTTGYVVASVGAISDSALVRVVDIIPPIVESTFPTDGDAAVSVDVTITIIFSEAMDRTTLDESTITVTGTKSGSIEGQITYPDDGRMFFDPATNLEFDEEVTVVVTNGVKDKAGNPLEEDFTFSFTTEYSKPEILYNYPNPAEGDQTTFRYYLNYPAKVSIQIFDLSGDFVEEISATTTGSGYGEVKWDLSGVAPGVYNYIFKAEYENGEVIGPVTKKAMVIR